MTFCDFRRTLETREAGASNTDSTLTQLPTKEAMWPENLSYPIFLLKALQWRQIPRRRKAHAT